MEAENKTLACVKRAHKKYAQAHPEKMCEAVKRYYHKNKNDPEFMEKKRKYNREYKRRIAAEKRELKKLQERLDDVTPISINI